jgi:tetratricopeptide (TPR) repeat protein
MTGIDQNLKISSPRYLAAFFLLFFLISLIYSNTLNCSWHFDDNSNILNNQNVHLEDFEFSTIIKSFYHWDNSHIYRPINYLSFALNWFVGRDIVTGYHLINILIHVITAYFLYLVSLKLLYKVTPNSLCSLDNHSIALLAAALWAANPIHVQAITFIVQRATSLSALFSIIALYTYILGREKGAFRLSAYHYLLCFLCFLLALGSKENAILLPGSLVLIEFFFFRDKPLQKKWKNFIIWLCSVSLLLIFLYFLASIVLIDKISINLFNHDGRNFTLQQRLLTEPRVLLLYLSQIAYPLSSRLSLEHDVILSTSLMHPWTTLPAIIIILFTVGLGFRNYKRYPLISFAIIFFFYNHIIESTFVPLEIIFEHRNYLPSFFLFLPVVSFLAATTERYSRYNLKLSYVPILVMAFFLIQSGVNTYLRNLDWKTKKSLIIDSIQKAPNQARPYHNLASYLLNHEKNVDEALNLFKIALTKESPSKHGPKYQTLDAISKIYMEYHNDYQSAIPILREALSEKPESLTPRKNLAISLMAVGELDEALQHIDVLLKKRPIDYKLKDSEKISRQYLLCLKALVLLKQNSFSGALTSAKEAVILAPDDPLALANIGLALCKMGEYQEADKYLSKLYALQRNPELITFLLLLENSLRSKDLEKANEVATHIVLTFPVKDIFSTLAQLDKSGTLQPLDPKILQPCLLQKLSELGSSTNISNFSLSKPLSKFSK